MKAAVAVGLAAMVALVLGLVTLAGAATGTGATTAAAVVAELIPTCTVSGPVPGLDAGPGCQRRSDRDRHVRGRGREPAGGPDRADDRPHRVRTAQLRARRRRGRLGGTVPADRGRRVGDRRPRRGSDRRHPNVRAPTAGRARLVDHAAMGSRSGGATLRCRRRLGRRRQLQAALGARRGVPGRHPRQRQHSRLVRPRHPERGDRPRSRSPGRLHDPGRDRRRARPGRRLRPGPAGQAVRVGRGRPELVRLLRV